MSPIEGGFPPGERRANAVQVRVSSSGMEFLRDHAQSLLGQLLDGDSIEFPVPPDCNSDPKVCCYVPEGYCGLRFDLAAQQGDSPRLELTAVGGNRVGVTLRARLSTVVPMPVDQSGLLGEIECYVSVDSQWSGSPFVTVYTEMEMTEDPVTGATRFDVAQSSFQGVSAGDTYIDGGFMCNFGSEQEAADSLNTQIAEEIPQKLADFLCASCVSDADCAPFGSCGDDGVCLLPGQDRCMQHLALSGRLPASALLGSLVPVDAQALDLYLAVGGHASSGEDGLSLGVLTGALPSAPPETHSCVPRLPAPPAVDLAATTTLETNTHPITGETFDVALGIHREFLERAAWAAHQAGYLCLDIGARKVPLLTASSIAVLAPSLIDLLHGEDAPLFLLVRPQTAPEIHLGAGTFITDANGIKTIDEPLIEILMRDLEVDWYAFVDQRYVRIMTLVADLRVPIGLDVDGDGAIMPVLGDLTEGFENLRVTNSGLLGEDPSDIAAKFPAVLSVALPGISDELSAFALPELAGFSLTLGPDSFTSVDGNSILAIFADLALAGGEESKAKVPRVATTARVVGVDAEAGRVDLALGGESASGGALEWQVRVDGGFWSPFSSAERIGLVRGGFLLQGRHHLEVRAREIGRPATTDSSPVSLEVTIGTRPPRVIAEAGNALQLNGPVVGFHGQVPSDSSCDCTLTGDPKRNLGGLFLVALVALVLVRAPRRRSAVLALLVAGALVMASACSSQETAGDDDDDSVPTSAEPGPTGRWASMAADSSRVLVAAYEQEYGDLVLAEVTEEGRPEFEVVDGSPGEPVVFDPSTYRGGVVAAGADVGAWTSIAFSAGSAAIAYQDRDRGSLRFARETDSGWLAHDVDTGAAGDGSVLGMYASLSFDAEGIPGIAYMAVTRTAGEDSEPPTPDRVDAELRWAQARSAEPASPEDWSIELVAAISVTPDADFQDVPVGTGLFASAGHRADGRAVVAFYDQVAADLDLAVREGEDQWTVTPLDATEWDRGQWCSLAVAGDDSIYVVYQDSNTEQLLAVQSLADGSSTPVEIVDDARRDGERPHAVGGSARALIAPDGEPMVAYQDGTTSDLLVARRHSDGSWSRSELLGGEVGYGFYIGAAVRGDEVWVSTYAYDQNSWPPGHTEVKRVR